MGIAIANRKNRCDFGALRGKVRGHRSSSCPLEALCVEGIARRKGVYRSYSIANRSLTGH